MGGRVAVGHEEERNWQEATTRAYTAGWNPKSSFNCNHYAFTKRIG